MRRRPKPADRLANIFRTVIFLIVLGESAALLYLLTRPKPQARSEFLVEPGKNHSLLIEDERFPIPARPGQKIVVTVENPKTPLPDLPEQRPAAPRPEEAEAAPKEPRFLTYFNTPEELKWFRLEEKLDNLRGRDDWNTVLNIAKWTREQFEPGIPSDLKTQNAQKLLRALRSGKEQGGSLQYAQIASQVMQALGGSARVVSIAGHDVVEVWVPSHRRWIVIDPMNVVHFEDAKGRKLSALEVFRKQDEARAVPATTSASAQPAAYRSIAYWLRNNLFTKPLPIYDLNRWRVRAILDSSDLAQVSAGDLYTFFPDEMYAAPETRRRAEPVEN